MSKKRKFNEEEQDVQDVNEVENVQAEETIEGQISDPTPDEGLHGADDHDGQDDSAGESDDSGGDNDTTPDEEQDTFDRAYVEKLRKENAKYRDRAKRTDELAHRLHTALVAADGRLADPADLPYDEAHLDDPDALTAAVTALVKTKPGLRAQQIRGDVGAGDRGTPKKAPVDLIGIMRGM